MEPTHLQRLAFIKYLFSIGVHQSYQPEPLCGVSILSFHDSVELFFRLSLEKLNISTGKEPAFMEHFDIIDNHLKGTKLSQKERIRCLDKARGNLKHLGVTPSRLDIESFRITTLAFFNENCPIVFQLDFDKISLIDLIKFERPRELLKQANSNYEKGLVYETIQNLILSFRYLIRDYEESKKDRLHGSPFFFGDSMRSLSSFHLGLDSDNREAKDWVDKVTESIEAIQNAIKILSFGIDYKKYIRYRLIVASVQVSISESGRVVSYMHGEVKLNKEDLDFCINFIVESALKLQEFDFELKTQ
jgi:hypothetical protein